MSNKQDFKRLYILGAGFSQPAGLPLGTELLNEILTYSGTLNGHWADEIKGVSPTLGGT